MVAIPPSGNIHTLTRNLVLSLQKLHSFLPPRQEPCFHPVYPVYPCWLAYGPNDPYARDICAPGSYPGYQ